VRLGHQSEEVLLPVKPPFLCHSRLSASSLAGLKHELTLRGIGGWRDTDDLRLGAVTNDELRSQVVGAGGFIWYGTRPVLDSPAVRGIELPAAIKAARDPRYPLVPLFVDLDPKSDPEAITRAYGERVAKHLLGRNGVVRSRTSERRFHRMVADRYLRDALQPRDTGDLTFLLDAHTPRPSESADLVMGWRDGWNLARRTISTAQCKSLTLALADVRAAGTSAGITKFRIEANLPLPLAFLAGYEWRSTTGISLGISSGGLCAASGGLSRIGDRPRPKVTACDGDGPTLIATSTGNSISADVASYAQQIQARRIIELHHPGPRLDADAMRRLASATVNELRESHGRGEERHLLLKCPIQVAMLVGTTANGIGRTYAPLHGADGGYPSGVWVG
jgi:hypothetical protein